MQEERYIDRRRDYSAWHRRASTSRYVGIENAQLLSMVDLDASIYVEYDDGDKEPLALIETAQDVGQAFKSATVTLNLAKRAGIPCYVVLYTLSDEPNPADKTWKDISCFRVRRLYPERENEWRTLTPQEWSEALLAIRKWSADKIDKREQATKARMIKS